MAVERSSGGPFDDKEYLLSVYRPGSNGGEVDLDILDERYATIGYVDQQIKDIDIGSYMPKSGGQFKGAITFNRGGKDSAQYKIAPNSGTDFATNIYSLGNGQMRLRTSQTKNEGDAIGSHIVLDPGSGSPKTKIYKVVDPTSDDMAAYRKYVNDHKAKVRTGTSTAPTLAKGELYFNTSTQQLFIGS